MFLRFSKSKQNVAFKIRLKSLQWRQRKRELELFKEFDYAGHYQSNMRCKMNQKIHQNVEGVERFAIAFIRIDDHHANTRKRVEIDMLLTLREIFITRLLKLDR